MATNIDEAIVARWDESGLDAVVTGGLHFGVIANADEAGISIEMPYAAFVQISKTSLLWTNKTQIHDHAIQFSLFDRTKSACESLAAAVKNAFDFAQLSFDSAAVLEVRPANDDGLVAKQADDTWQVTLTYRIRYAKSSNSSPSE